MLVLLPREARGPTALARRTRPSEGTTTVVPGRSLAVFPAFSGRAHDGRGDVMNVEAIVSSSLSSRSARSETRPSYSPSPWPVDFAGRGPCWQGCSSPPWRIMGSPRP